MSGPDDYPFPEMPPMPVDALSAAGLVPDQSAAPDSPAVQSTVHAAAIPDRPGLLGVIGGLGPMATAYFYELIIQMTDARCDQDHLEMLIYSRPSIPDRTGYILGQIQESPLPLLIETGLVLARNNVTCLAVPCITAHYFYPQLAAALPVPVIHIIAETVTYLQAAGIRRAGLLATDGTLASGLFQQALEAAGLSVAVPDTLHQQAVMHVIYQNVKAGRPVEIDRFLAAAGQLKNQGAEVIILGCTELSLIKRDYSIGPGYLDAMEVLALRSLECCGTPLKPGCRQLIS